MPRSEQKRQKKQLKKNRRTSDLRKVRNQSLNMSNRQILMANNRGAWEGCYLSGQEGMYQIAAVRQSRTGYISSIFLVDTYCLGVKEAFLAKDLDMDYMRDNQRSRDAKKIDPAYALAIINKAIEYAHNLGLEPHSETEMCLLIFNGVDSSGIDVSSVDKPIEFGRNGRPCFTNGPQDSLEMQNRVIATLETKLGPGNFDVVRMGGETDLERGLGYNPPEKFEEDQYGDSEDGDSEDGESYDGEVLDATEHSKDIHEAVKSSEAN